MMAFCGERPEMVQSYILGLNASGDRQFRAMDILEAKYGVIKDGY